MCSDSKVSKRFSVVFVFSAFAAETNLSLRRQFSPCKGLFQTLQPRLSFASDVDRGVGVFVWFSSVSHPYDVIISVGEPPGGYHG